MRQRRSTLQSARRRMAKLIVASARKRTQDGPGLHDVPDFYYDY